MSADEFDDKYVVEPDCELPSSEKQIEFCNDIVFRAMTVDEAYVNNYTLSEKVIAEGKYKAKAQELADKLSGYISFLERTINKIVVPQSVMSKVISMRINLMADEVYDKMMYPEGKEVITSLQLGTSSPITFWGIEWKGELDYLVLDHVNEVAYVIDLKTTSKPLAYFHYEVKKYKYYRQLALYRKMVEQYLEDRNLFGWTVYTRFFVVETTGSHEAAVIPIPYNVLKVGEQELEEAAETINWYRHHGWSKYRSQVNNEGLLLLDWTSLGMYEPEVTEEDDEVDD